MRELGIGLSRDRFLNDRTVFQPSQPFLYSFVRGVRNGIFARFHEFHIHAHITVDAETVFPRHSGATWVAYALATIVLVGMQPVLTQVPPNLWRSTMATVLSAAENRAAQGWACLARPDYEGVEVLHCLRANFRYGTCPLSRLLRVFSHPAARRCKRRTIPTSGASEPSVRTLHDAALLRAKARSASRRPNC